MKHLFFDLDGTLVDSSEGIINSFTQTFTELKVEVPSLEVLKTFIGPPLEASFSHFGDETFVETAVAAYRVHYKNFGITQAKLYDGISEMLDCLANEGYRLYVATSKHEPMAIQMLSDFKIDNKFTAIFGSLNNDHKADILTRGMKTCQISPKRAIMIGDTHYDMIGGKSVGTKTIGVTWGFGSANQLLKSGADLLIDAPLDIIKSVETL
ncbi:HAD hydrolase-like protein [Streptococcus merionis]|uniref:HAD hydrolase-like protein n=1 Tax=Streptococcus merionis TaxID=400065 RepID=UPI0035165D75